MKLTPRAAQVVLLLTEQPEGYPLTLAAVSAQLQVSRRTLQRVLPEIRAWMEANNYHFIAKTGSGLALDEPAARRREIAEQLAAARESVLPGRSDARRGALLMQLLEADAPRKAAWLARRYDISEGTLEKELDALEQWLSPFQVTLHRRSGVGIYVTGAEDALRLALEAAVTQFFDLTDLLHLLQGQQLASCGHIPDFIVPEDVPCIHEILQEAEKRLEVCLMDSSFLGLFVQIALSISRIREGRLVSMEPARLGRLRLLPEYAVAEYITDQLFQCFGTFLPPDETGFIAMHLANCRVWQRNARDRTNAAELDVLHLALSMTRVMEEALQTSFHNNDALIDGLCNHLDSVCSRLHLGIPIGNPQLEVIRQGYPALFAAAQQACALLAQELDLDAVPDAEAGFIAMHYGAVLSERSVTNQQVSAVVVCPTGVGTSRLLAAELRRNYPQLQIIHILSALRLDTEKLQQEGIDLIISTMELNVKYRYVRVNPILTERDRMLLSAVLDTLHRQKPVREQSPPQAAARLTPQDIRFISALGDELLQLCGDVRIKQAPIIKNRAALYACAAQLFATDETAANDIELAFVRRDSLGDTYIKPFRALLLHCSTAFTTHCRLGYVRLEPPFYEKGKVMLGAVVMLIPAQDALQVCATLMSEVSALLIRRPSLLELMRAGDLTALTGALEVELQECYRSLVCKRLGVPSDTGV